MTKFPIYIPTTTSSASEWRIFAEEICRIVAERDVDGLYDAYSAVNSEDYAKTDEAQILRRIVNAGYASLLHPETLKCGHLFKRQFMNSRFKCLDCGATIDTEGNEVGYGSKMSDKELRISRDFVAWDGWKWRDGMAWRWGKSRNSDHGQDETAIELHNDATVGVLQAWALEVGCEVKLTPEGWWVGAPGGSYWFPHSTPSYGAALCLAIMKAGEYHELS